MRILLALSVLVAVLALAESCTVVCGYRRERYTVSCGFWGFSRCARYRTVPKRCPCPVDGNWTPWSNWRAITNCTVSCGGGKKNMTRERSCTNPAPQYGGQNCAGLAVEERQDDCNTAECPIDGNWSPWSDWRDLTSCTVSCGGGKKNIRRERSCTNPAPQYGGQNCAGLAVEERQDDCNTAECPIDGNWTPWSDWRDLTSCTVSCGGGKKNIRRKRSCTNPAPQYGGQNCAGPAVEEGQANCNTAKCPIDGKWTQWSNWRAITSCTVFCGGGKNNMTRERSCTNPEPQHGGDNCTGHAVEEKEDACNEAECGNLCPDNTVTFFADNNNNRYFYHCVHGDNSTKTKAYHMKCSDGTVWNQTWKACVLNTDTTSTTSTTSSTSTTAGCVNGAQTAHATDCSKFMQCVHGAYVEFSCSAGLQYNEALSVCDWPANANCQTGQP